MSGANLQIPFGESKVANDFLEKKRLEVGD